MIQHLSENDALCALRKTLDAAHADACKIQEFATPENIGWIKEKAHDMRAALFGAGNFIRAIENHARLRPQPTLRAAMGYTEDSKPDPIVLHKLKNP